MSLKPMTVKERCKAFHGEIDEEEYRKIAKESMKCPVCAGRPLLHMRLCMRKGSD